VLCGKLRTLPVHLDIFRNSIESGLEIGPLDLVGAEVASHVGHRQQAVVVAWVALEDVDPSLDRLLVLSGSAEFADLGPPAGREDAGQTSAFSAMLLAKRPEQGLKIDQVAGIAEHAQDEHLNRVIDVPVEVLFAPLEVLLKPPPLAL
jgi:hypothetical protein